MMLADPALPDPAQAFVASDALLALGRLDGALAMAQPATLRVFATRLLRELLVTALRQEGHAFTAERFHAWFAGVATLSDQPADTARPPRALCEAILTELAHSSWQVLATTAAAFQSALLAPSDHIASDTSGQTARQDAGAVIAAAREGLSGLAPSLDPLTGVERLHHAAATHILFAPSERAARPVMMTPIAMGSIRLTVERPALPCPRWALEMLWGEHWHGAGLLTHALPFPGLVCPGVLRALNGSPDEDPEHVPLNLAAALFDVAQALYRQLGTAADLARHLAVSQPGKRRSSRAPALLELLASFGPLRSAQLESLLGVTRLGLRAMLGVLNEADMLGRTTRAGVHLYTVTIEVGSEDVALTPSPAPSFSPDALAEYDTAMAEIDALLARNDSATTTAGGNL